MILLASASPRRADLLKAAGIPFDVFPADVDESIHAGEEPEAYARRLSRAKASTVLQRSHGRPVLAADTVVIIDGLVLGKPADAGDARRMLRLLSGKTHEVLTAVTLAVAVDGETLVARTTVEFAPLSSEEIDAYVASGEPMGKAGAYAIQGLASRFVTRISGSYSNVVGLPVALVYSMLKRAGV